MCASSIEREGREVRVVAVEVRVGWEREELEALGERTVVEAERAN